MNHIIKHVNIEKLFGTVNIDWELNPDVNVLVGQNGLGKSTILRMIKATLYHEHNSNTKLCDKITIKFINDEFCEINNQTDIMGLFDIKSIDNLIDKTIDKEVLEMLVTIKKIKLIENKTEKKLNLPSLSSFKQSKDCEAIKTEFISTINLSANSVTKFDNSSGEEVTFLDYEISNEIQRLLKLNTPSLIKNLTTALNNLFSETKKKVEFDGEELIVRLSNDKIVPISKLSSGERQVIFIFLKVIIASVDSTIILMDEPEISLHLSWQEKLLNEIRNVNNTSQLIIVTHSPAILMNGWMDSFVDISNIMTDISPKVE